MEDMGRGRHHDRPERRRNARVDVSPKEAPSTEVGYYATSLTGDRMGEKELSEAIRGHGSAIEAGEHHPW